MHKILYIGSSVFTTIKYAQIYCKIWHKINKAYTHNHRLYVAPFAVEKNVNKHKGALLNRNFVDSWVVGVMMRVESWEVA